MRRKNENRISFFFPDAAVAEIVEELKALYQDKDVDMSFFYKVEDR